MSDWIKQNPVIKFQETDSKLAQVIIKKLDMQKGRPKFAGSSIVPFPIMWNPIIT